MRADPPAPRSAGPFRAPAVVVIALLGLAAAALIAISFLATGVKVNEPAHDNTAVTPTITSPSSPLGEH